MKFINRIMITVFAKPEEDRDKIKQTLISMIPFDLEEEKIKLQEETATSFQERKIRIYKIVLEKERHTKSFIKNLLKHLTQKQKEYILGQKESRLDENLDFFIRIDKGILINENRYFITEFGNCFHIRISIAAFPKKREKAIEIIEKIFKD